MPLSLMRGQGSELKENSELHTYILRVAIVEISKRSSRDLEVGWFCSLEWGRTGDWIKEKTPYSTFLFSELPSWKISSLTPWEILRYSFVSLRSQKVKFGKTKTIQNKQKRVYVFRFSTLQNLVSDYLINHEICFLHWGEG